MEFNKVNLPGEYRKIVEAQNWLHDNMGIGGLIIHPEELMALDSKNQELKKWYSSSYYIGPSGHAFYFLDPQDAMIFKLMWCSNE